MLRLEDSIHIHRSRSDLYRLISDVEGHAVLLPGYSESKIIQQDGDHYVVQREAIIHGRKRRWTSEVRFEPDRALHFRQLEGPLRDMKILWELSEEDSTTQLRITHEMDVRPRWKGWWMERFVAKPAIEKTARRVLEAIKESAEKETLK